MCIRDSCCTMCEWNFWPDDDEINTEFLCEGGDGRGISDIDFASLNIKRNASVTRRAHQALDYWVLE